MTPLLGTLPPLVVVPVGNSSFEGWRFLPEDEDTSLGYQSQTFEGLYSFEFHTLAYAENEVSTLLGAQVSDALTRYMFSGRTRLHGTRQRQ